ncbi:MULTISPECIES: GNAT family acetyltransferase [unclassified Microbacterium]|uniref:GNAT family acetyltransferase n=1 Tax=unclassified Microbacterium TaxID=2609290 RepID=UPI00214B0B4B|nr:MULTISPECIES: GNAT family acetyltransferase [unclassified Microbacterium]MCR2810009.1 GNAT family acetyltransferase [Microbacterium sp. zg.B185]WIM20150.1 GNAT family acetyltransferase [Microbacterium sp. zg-B185]
MTSIRAFALRDTESVIALWQSTGLTRSWNNPHLDIQRKLQVQPELFLVAVDGEDIVGSVMAGYDGHRGWLYYLASDPLRRGQGIGRALVAAAEEALLDMGCPKVQLMVRPDNRDVLGFYDSLGYDRFDTTTTGKRLIAD